MSSDIVLELSVEHDRYGIRGMANNWFKSYLFDKKQFVSINDHVFNEVSVKYGVLEGSVLGPLLFLIYFNYLNLAIKFCKVHHFAGSTNLLHFSKSVNKLNNYISILICLKILSQANILEPIKKP